MAETIFRFGHQVYRLQTRLRLWYLPLHSRLLSRCPLSHNLLWCSSALREFHIRARNTRPLLAAVKSSNGEKALRTSCDAPPARAQPARHQSRECHSVFYYGMRDACVQTDRSQSVSTVVGTFGTKVQLRICIINDVQYTRPHGPHRHAIGDAV